MISVYVRKANKTFMFTQLTHLVRSIDELSKYPFTSSEPITMRQMASFIFDGKPVKCRFELIEVECFSDLINSLKRGVVGDLLVNYEKYRELDGI